MKKMTLSLTDDLHEKAEKFRDRINFSKVFQDALRREISRFEDLRIDVKDMEAALERLLVSKADDEKYATKLGYKWGKYWAKELASYIQLKHYVTESKPRDELPYGVREEITPDIEGEEGPNIIIMELIEFNEGFYEGAKAVWEVVKDKI